MAKRQVVATNQADLHLIWFQDHIYVKPLPSYLLDGAFWAEHINPNHALRAEACGFLLSYTWFISSEVDFHMATNPGGAGEFCPPLLPASLTWEAWAQFVAGFLENVDLETGRSESINRRWWYGALSLKRLNLIYTFVPIGDARWWTGTEQYYNAPHRSFFRRNFDWLVALFAYVAVVLTAMQTGLATDALAGNAAFQSASYGFVVFSILLPIAWPCFVAYLFLIRSLVNSPVILFLRTFGPQSHARVRQKTARRSDAEASQGHAVSSDE
jgi:hypothetical protein